MLSTFCPICRTKYRLNQQIARSQGIAECTTCDTVYDALAALAEVDSEQNTTFTDATVQIGDKQIIRHSGLTAATPWYASQEITEVFDVPPERDDEDREIEPNAGGEGIRFFELALRNLIRNRKRSGVALAAIVFGVVAILLAGGFIEWILDAMRESAIRSQYGHAQIVRPGYFEDGAANPFAYLLPATDELTEKIAQEAGVDTIAPRIFFSGLASRDETTLSFIGQGVDPAKEVGLSDGVIIRAGEPLDANDTEKIVVGSGLADTLGVVPGDSIVLLATSGTGGINAIEVTVGGIFVTSVKAFDDTALRVHIDAARELLKVSGSHSWVVLLDDTSETDRIVQTITTLIGESTDKYEASPWYERAEFYNKTEQLFSRQVNLVWIIIGLLILLSISNTMMMSVLERTREIGTLIALGLTRKSIMRLFLQEGFVLGAIGAVTGLLLGLSLAFIISAVGIPMPPPPGMDVGFDAEILVTIGLAVSAMLIAIFSTTAAAIYPAHKASRLNVVDALRHNQ